MLGALVDDHLSYLGRSCWVLRDRAVVCPDEYEYEDSKKGDGDEYEYEYEEEPAPAPASASGTK